MVNPTERIKMLENILKIWIGSVLSASADYITTQIGLKYPELYELHPLYDPKKAVAIHGGAGTIILATLRSMDVDERVAFITAMIPPSLPLIGAVNNLAHIIYAHRNVYPWKECPLLYPE